jgi:hypothetical protein
MSIAAFHRVHSKETMMGTSIHGVTRTLLLAASLAVTSTAAQATLITFDELPWVPGDGWPPPLPGDTYASLGVLIDGGLLSRSDDTVSPPQYLLGGNSGSITFTGELPRYVSFYISSTLSDGESWALASGPGGYSQREGTGGWPGGDSPHPIPYPEMPVDNSLVSFASASGIERLDFFNAYNQRFSAAVDNLYFGAVPAIPEPAPLALAAIGLACLAGFSRLRPARP